MLTILYLRDIELKQYLIKTNYLKQEQIRTYSSTPFRVQLTIVTQSEVVWIVKGVYEFFVSNKR